MFHQLRKKLQPQPCRNFQIIIIKPNHFSSNYLQMCVIGTFNVGHPYLNERFPQSLSLHCSNKARIFILITEVTSVNRMKPKRTHRPPCICMCILQQHKWHVIYGMAFSDHKHFMGEVLPRYGWFQAMGVTWWLHLNKLIQRSEMFSKTIRSLLLLYCRRVRYQHAQVSQQLSVT